MVCGCIGAGKTTAVRLLGQAFGYDADVEDCTKNPFVERFYDEPERWAFPSQLHFLLEMMGRSRDESLANGCVRESDVNFVIDVFSCELRQRGWMSEEELALLRQVALLKRSRRPDVYVHVDADTATLLKRIADRGRLMEQGIDAGYLDALRRRYQDALDQTDVPILTVRTDRIDIRKQACLRKVVAELDAVSQAPSGAARMLVS